MMSPIVAREKLLNVARQFIKGTDIEILNTHLKDKHLKFNLLVQLPDFKINNANLNNILQVKDVLKIYGKETPKELISKHDNLFIQSKLSF